ncbi:MAG: acyl-CoA oxidase [Myxococcota bacterium]|jgi:acyl-CoA oxidase
MIYVAWADGELTDAEVTALHAALPGDHPALKQWLDPTNPPTATQLQDLLRRLEEAAETVGLPRQHGLIDLGLSIAGLSDAEGEWAAVRELEKTLGLYGSAASRRFFPPEAPSDITVSGPDWSPEAMAALLDGPRGPWKAKVRALLADPFFRHPGEINTTEYRSLVLRWCQALADRGFLDSLLPAASGGRPDVGGFVATFATLATFDLSLLVKFGVQFGLFGCSILFLGSEEQKHRYLADIFALRLPGCFAMTERAHGSNVRDLETTATYDDGRDGFVIDTPHPLAGKEWIGNAAEHGHMATVFAQLSVGGVEHGVHAFLVPIRRPDGSPAPRVRIADCGHKMGLNGVDNGRLWFDRVFVPRDSLLSRFATIDEAGQYHSPIASPGRRFFTMLGALVGGRVSVAAASVNVAASALTIAIRYSARRRQFGPEGGPEVPILRYPTHRLRLLPRLAATYALHFAAEDLTTRYAKAVEEDGDMREVEALAAGIKAIASWHATDTVQTSRECCGGQGYAAINRFAALKADSDVFSTFEGDNIVLMQLVAKAVLGQFRSRFSDTSPVSMIRHLAEIASSRVSEKNPIITRWTQQHHLRNGAFHNDILAGRTIDLTLAIARGIRRDLDGADDPFDAFNRWQPAMVELARAHVEHTVHDRFRRVVEDCTDPALAAVLNDLCDLYALSRIEAERGWFLENGYLTPAKSQAIRAEVMALCDGLAGEAVALVDAFAIPDEAIGAPIAMR